ncbi:MAG TPA: 2'-5' RNA ligase family protein [Rhizomicrobium sp.]|jgi:2'-5' RNA ligase
MGALLADLEQSDRLFFCLYPDAQTAAQIAALAHRIKQAHGLSGEPLRAGRLHVSQHHLGDYAGIPDAILANAFVAGGSVAMRPFTVTFDRVESFTRGTRSRPLVLRSSDENGGLTALHQNLGAAMKRTGLGHWAHAGFTPHMTLLYDDTLVEEMPVAPISWTVREVTLVHSLLGRKTHIRLASWALRG